MKAYSLDLHERALAAVNAKQETPQEIADRMNVSRQWVGRMTAQREQLRTLAVQTHRCGRKPRLSPEHLLELAELVAQKHDRTLRELKDLLQVDCCLQVNNNHYLDIRHSFAKAASHSLRSGGGLI